MATVLNGNRVRDEILGECRPRVDALKAAGRPPGLAVILVGNNPASEIYVRNKIKACQTLGIYSEKITPSAGASTEELIELVESLNRRPEIDGILPQLPLPSQIDAKQVQLAVSPDKDVDGLHPLSLGRLAGNLPGLRPCTPAGILELLKRYEIAISSRSAVVVGRSDLVGKPVALLLMHGNATVTICHSRTPNLAEVCARADILVAAMGRPALITRDFIKPGATVIDVGTNRISSREDAARIFRNSAAKLEEFDRKGSLLVGDVDPVDVAEVAGAYSPVPGGVGPLTISMLMVNTIEAAERKLGKACSA
jgi:methylenetetrahydrofolate dehydrogenase (NADP+)/methenyltetrahydrofolate cyclohydrolase